MSVPNVTAPSPAATDLTAPVRTPVQTLGQEEFIKILVAQLTSQDPMNPQKDTEFIGQMAQFSQLESSRDLKTELQNLHTQQDFLKASALLGRQVQFRDGENAGYVGTVTGLEVQEGEPLLAAGSRIFALSDVMRVAPAETGRSHAK